jgi:Skp family chaperone for outer membrane proteins
MKRLLISACLAASAILPSAAAHAQAIPPAIIAVVDLDRVSSECNACKTAAAALRSQQTSFENRRQTLAAPLQAEGKSIQAAVEALNGKEPDATLQARAKAFQAKQQQGVEELQRQAQQLERNQAYVNQQIRDKLNTVYTPVMQKRGANMVVEIGTTLASSSNLDVTNDVLTALNAAMPSIQTIAPAAAANPARPQQQPQGR